VAAKWRADSMANCRAAASRCSSDFPDERVWIDCVVDVVMAHLRGCVRVRCAPHYPRDTQQMMCPMIGRR
jgi:hypothetical protein